MLNLFVILDGVGYDQVTYFRPPCLTTRAERTGLAALPTLLSYSSGIYASIWSGRYPDEHGVWADFYRHQHSRPALTGALGVVPGKYCGRKLAAEGLRGLARLGVARPEYPGVPPQVQRYFGYAPARSRQVAPADMPDSRLIWSIIEESGQTWEYICCDLLDDSSEARIKETARRVDTLVVCFSELDSAGHHLGPLSDAFGAVFQAFDARLGRLLAGLESGWPDPRIFLFSDHGMTPVSAQFDAWSYLEGRGLRLGHDYLGFFHATMIALWPGTGRHADLIAALNASRYGRVLTADERRQYHVDFRSPQYGREFFVANEGVEIIPNFTSLADRPHPGMHGYDPACSSTRAFYIGGRQAQTQPQDIAGLYDVLVETTGALSFAF